MKEYLDVSIVIPSKDNPDNVIKLINYYKSVNYTGYILIGDGSKYLNDNTKKNILSTNDYPFKLLYNHWPLCSEINTTLKLLELVETNYVAWSGDDDYYTIDGIYNSVDFLKNNKKYISVHGDIIMLGISKKHNKILNARFYEMIKSDNVDPLSRLSDYIFGKSGDPFYAIHRTQQMKNNYKYGGQIEDHLLATGELPALMAMLQGPCAKIKGISLIRTNSETHLQRNRPDLITKILSDNWTKDYSKLKSILVGELNRSIDNLSKDYIEKLDILLKTRLLMGLSKNQSSYFLKFKRNTLYYNLAYFQKLITYFNSKFNAIRNKYLFYSIRKGFYSDYVNIKPVINSILG